MSEIESYPRDLRIPHGNVFSDWVFSVGDAVSSKKHGVGIVISRSVQEQYVMDRPTRICQFETYSVSFSKKIKSVYRCEIRKLEDEKA